MLKNLRLIKHKYSKTLILKYHDNINNSLLVWFFSQFFNIENLTILSKKLLQLSNLHSKKMSNFFPTNDRKKLQLNIGISNKTF
jgi:hypothetical protein